MAETDFFQYLADSLRTMLTIRAEELLRVTFSKELYAISKTELRPQAEIDIIVRSMQEPIDQLVEKYLIEMKERGLITPELIEANGLKLREITSGMEQNLEQQLMRRLGRK